VVPWWGAQLLRLRREAEERVDFALLERLDRFDRGVCDPVDIGNRVEPDMGRHSGQEYMLVRPQARHTDALTL
jgi:hypothetical protein